METLRNMFARPDPQAQYRKCNALLRANMRKLDRDIAALKQTETKTKNLIIAANKRAQRGDASRQRQAQREVRDFARELIRTRKASNRLVTGRAQLASVQMQVSEAFALRRIEGSIRAGVGIMKDVNALIRLPQFAQTMQELSVELMKAGIIEEMVGEVLPEDGDALAEGEDEEAEGEIDKVLGEILKDRMETAGPLPSVPLPQQQVPAQQQPQLLQQQQQQQQVEEEEDEEDTEAMMDQMRNRLEALRS
ncbi:Snf7-domain-containing protein [Corynascus novoguineensis]|uniref:Snf7-domain-containing protein n=1 Tax=Corynascus novoguineensis TaxID=1126955 RepID=A0AAN7CSC0_9PEZI|nr:Snf7-domain-containing protein [Corynascus novoguineensis]